MKDKDFKKAGEVVEFLESMIGKTRDGVKKYNNLFQDWDALISNFYTRNRKFKELASHSRIHDVKGNSLVIDIDHSGWMQIFDMEKKNFLNYLQKKFPELELKSIRLRLIADLNNPPSIKNVQFDDNSFAPTGKMDELGDKPAIERVKDDDFKNLLSRLGKSIKDKNKK